LVDFSSVAASLRVLAVFFGVVVLAYAGFVLVTNQSPETRNEWKEIAAGVIIGLCILFIAPVIATAFTGGTYCGG